MLGSAAGRSTPPMAKVALGRTCCFSTVFAAAFLVAGGVASSVSSLFFTAGDFPIPVSYFFPGDAGRGGRCGGSHGREGGGEGQSVPPSRAPVFVLPRGSVWNSKHSTMIKGSPAFKEEQGSNTECCIEGRVHQKTKMKTAPVADQMWLPSDITLEGLPFQLMEGTPPLIFETLHHRKHTSISP